MKVKMKFDLASIKAWLFEHGEKLAFGTMVLVFLMFAYSALQREVLDPTKGETRLSETARAVTDHVSKSTWDVKNAGVQIVDYKERAKRDPVPPEAFATNKPLAWPIFDPKGKRDDPEIYSIEEPRASAGVGTFALKGAEAPAGATPGGRTRRWAVAGPKRRGGVQALERSEAQESGLGRGDGTRAHREANGGIQSGLFPCDGRGRRTRHATLRAGDRRTRRNRRQEPRQAGLEAAGTLDRGSS